MDRFSEWLVDATSPRPKGQTRRVLPGHLPSEAQIGNLSFNIQLSIIYFFSGSLFYLTRHLAFA